MLRGNNTNTFLTVSIYNVIFFENLLTKMKEHKTYSIEKYNFVSIIFECFYHLQITLGLLVHATAENNLMTIKINETGMPASDIYHIISFDQNKH